MPGILFKVLNQCRDGAIISLMVRALLLSLLASAVLCVLLYVLLLNLPYGQIPLIGSWLADSDTGAWVFGASVPIFSTLFMIFVFPYVMIFVVGFFQDEVIRLVEARYYPDLPGLIPRRLSEEVRVQAIFFLKVVAVNLLMMPFYLVLLFTVFGAVILITVVNGYLIGVELYAGVSLRRLTYRQFRGAIGSRRLAIHLYGILIYGCMLVPILNLVMPVLGSMMMTHLFHQHHGGTSYMTTGEVRG